MLRSLIVSSSRAIISNVNSIRTKPSIRCMAVRKRFYRKTGILQSSGKYEVTLDQHKLKTPKGNLFEVDSEPLALAVAAEWDSQKEKIVQTSMHLTTLCNTVIDNPNNLTKYDIAEYITNYMSTDTILFQSDIDDDLYKLQMAEWDPVIQWFCDRFQIDLQKSRDIGGKGVSEKAKAAVTRYLLSHNFAAVNGFVYGVDTLKSPILTIACVERLITTEKAVLLSRLEEEFQLGYWGRVEWAHDLSQQELQARISATIMFIHLNSSSTHIRNKQVN